MRSHLRLSALFLAPYYAAGDPFGSLLARSVYKSKYCRDGECWTDTVRRVVEGNCAFDPTVTQAEAEALFDLFWYLEAQPPGRGWWTGGVDGIPADASYNCWYTTLYGIEDWCWTADRLMLGGGVGVGLSRLASMPLVARGEGRLRLACSLDHADLGELGMVYEPRGDELRVEDSRQGWVQALGVALRAAFAGRSVAVDVSLVRRRGTPIRTFGGIACGPGPLVDLLRSVWAVVRGAVGRRLSSVEAIDITTLIGRCIKSGNVRRSALLVLGAPDDHDFRQAKSSESVIHSHRHASNNSLAFEDEGELADFDWLALVRDNLRFGDPGILNLWKARETDPGVEGVNPCGEQTLHHKEACNLAEVFPARFRPNTAADKTFRLVTRYCLRNRLRPLADPEADEVGRRNMRIGVGLGGVCDFAWTRPLLRSWFRIVRDEADEYAIALGVARPITTTTVKPSGTTSILNDSSPGMHAPFAEHYVRRTRLADNEPMAHALREAGVPCELDLNDHTGRTLVFSFPVAKRGARQTQQHESVRSQLERQVALQEEWADNAVSATIFFRPEQPEELAEALRDFAPRLKSTSFLALRHGYKQAPYEAIDASTFERLHAQIDHNHPLAGGEVEVEECAGGACPVR